MRTKDIIIDILKNSLISIGIFHAVNMITILTSTMVILICEHTSAITAAIIITIYTLIVIAFYIICGMFFIGKNSPNRVYNIISCVAVLVIQMIPALIFKSNYSEFLYPFIPIYILTENHFPKELNTEVCLIALPWIAITLGAIMLKNHKEKNYERI